MKRLKYYKGTLQEDVFTNFIDTLQRSITSWDYFVDWVKVKKNVDEVYTELNILNSLLGSVDIEKDFYNLCKKYPEVKKALPILIAVRRNQLGDLPIMENVETFSVIEVQDLFEEENTNYKGLLKFFNDSGLKEIFKDGSIKNLVDYITGVEVGMDTNGRKNRTGGIMEEIVEKKIKAIAERRGFEYGEQMTVSAIKRRWNITVPTDKSKRKFDFVVFNGKEITLFEVNFYRCGGTKLKATAEEYINLDNLMRSSNIKFAWITDGLGWKNSHISLENAFVKNDYIFNLGMINNGILEEIL